MSIANPKSNNPNIAKDGKKGRFSSTNQPANPGRKKSVLKQLKDIDKLGRQDIINLIHFYLNKERSELQQILEDSTTKGTHLLLVSAIMHAVKRGQFSEIQAIMDLLFGKEVQKIKIESVNHNIDYSLLDDDEIETLLELAKKATNAKPED